MNLKVVIESAQENEEKNSKTINPSDNPKCFIVNNRKMGRNF